MPKDRGNPGSAPEDNSPVALTARETEVVGLVIKGLSEPEIAARLGIARSTVHFHVEQARRKLGARNRAQLAALAVARGLAEP